MPNQIVQVSRAGKVIGQASVEEVKSGMQSGLYLLTDHYWVTGMQEWKPLKDFPYGVPIVPSLGASSSVKKLLTKEEWLALPDGAKPICPRCSSTDLRTFAILLKTGTSSSVSVGVTLSGELGAMETATRSTLAAELTPPKDIQDAEFNFTYALVMSCAIGACLVTLYGMLGVALSVVIAVGIFYFTPDSRAHELQSSQNGFRAYIWRNSWCCMACGTKAVSLHPRAQEASALIDSASK